MAISDVSLKGSWDQVFNESGKETSEQQTDIDSSITLSHNTEVQLSLEKLVKEMFSFLHQIAWGEGTCFTNFPTNCCFNSAFFSGLVLERLGFEPVFWVWGHRESTRAHVWCEYDEFTIDLTAGQYADCTCKYILNNNRKTKVHEFTSSFRIIEKGTFDDKFRLAKNYSDLLKIAKRFIALRK
ncbi:hypothetical protein MASR2M29_02620 [Spirochaetota bacterium]